MESPEQVFTRDQIIDRVLGYTYEGFERTIDAHVRNLRKKIEPDADSWQDLLVDPENVAAGEPIGHPRVWQVTNIGRLTVFCLKLNLQNIIKWTDRIAFNIKCQDQGGLTELHLKSIVLNIIRWSDIIAFKIKCYNHRWSAGITNTHKT